MTEIELKLSASPAELKRLRRHPLFKTLARGRSRSTELYSTYFDTPDASLQARGFALRLRRAGERWLQTLKADGKVEAGLHQRPEWETPCVGGQLDFGALSGSAIGDLLAQPEVRLRLAPVFVTAFRRTLRVLGDGAGGGVKLCIDQGEIRAGEKTEPISEIELEATDGVPAGLFEIAVALQETVPLRIENRSKAERGYALLHGARKPFKVMAPALIWNTTVNGAFKAICFSALEQVQRNECGMLAGEDPEYLHQMRVAVRRLRSAFSIFRNVITAEAMAPALDEIKWLGRILGAARDLDLFALETMLALQRDLPDREWTGLQTGAAQKRSVAGSEARTAVSSARYSRLMLNLSAWLATEPWRLTAEASVLDAPLEAFSARSLKKQHRRVKEFGARCAQLAPDERHRLRIKVKKLRYAAQFFSSLYAKKAVQRYAAGLARLQDVLGALTDAQSAGAIIGQIDDAETQAIALAQGWAAGANAMRLREIESAFAKFNKVKIFW
jgi:inorganic triphosphatase YgiF